MTRERFTPRLFLAMAMTALPQGSGSQSVKAQEMILGSGTFVVQAPTIATLDDLARLSTPQLEQLYRQSSPGSMPTGRVRGRALYPDVRFGVARSHAARAVWQGKVFRPEDSTAVNRFFGLRMIEGNVSAGLSWFDGGPSLILDYQGTSRIYGSYRDEIREVAPGLYLGLMYDRTTAPPSRKMFFAFDRRP